MKFVKIPPPGTFCHREAIFEMVAKSGAKTFAEVGCGDASLSRELCERGLTGFGIDASKQAIELASEEIRHFIENGRYTLIQGDVLVGVSNLQPVDLCISIMVMEHIENDLQFLQELKHLVKPGGHIIVAVPGRRDCWSFEDETVGHYRRYDRTDMQNVLAKAGLSEVTTWSVAVPTANLLANLGNFLLKRSTSESSKLALTKKEQTDTSGIREVPFKTVFPPIFKLILNRVTLSPLLFVQRFFYQSNFGLILMSLAKVRSDATRRKTDDLVTAATEL